MTNSHYEQRLAEAVSALKQGEEGNWNLARLTYESTLRHGGNGNEQRANGLVPMAQWANDIRQRSGRRFSETTGYRYRKVWERHGATSESSSAVTRSSFMDAYAEVDGTPSRDRMMEYEGTRLLEKGTPEQKVEQAAALLRDPEVRQAARDVSTPLGGAVFGVAEEAKTQRQHEGDALDRVREARTQTDPVLKGLDESKAQGDLIAANFAYAKTVAALLPRIDHLPSADNDPFLTNHFLRASLAQVQGAAEQVADLLRTGKVGGGVDAFLKAVLEGGDKGK